MTRSGAALRSDRRETEVADEDPKATGPFDVATIRALVALMSRHDLSEIDLRQGEQRMRLRRGALKTTTVTAMPQQAALPARACQHPRPPTLKRQRPPPKS